MRNPRLEEMRDSITSRVFGHWWAHRMARTGKVRHLDGGLAAVGQVRGRLVGPLLPAAPGLARLYQRLERPKLLLLCLPDLLRDQGRDVRRAAAEAVGGLGGAAATPAFLARLADLLRYQVNTPTDRDKYVRLAAARAVGELGRAAATPEFLARLPDLLRDQHGVRGAAVKAVGGLGEVAATPEFLARLPDLLRDKHRHVRTAAKEVVGKLGGAAATPEVLARLPDLLRDKHEYVRTAAAEAVGGLGGAAATPAFLACLADLLRDQDEDVRGAAAKAVSKLGPVAATPDYLAQLAAILNSPSGERDKYLPALATFHQPLGLRFVRDHDTIVPRTIQDLGASGLLREDCS